MLTITGRLENDLTWMMSSPGMDWARGCTMTARGMAVLRSRSELLGTELRVQRMARGVQLPLSFTTNFDAAGGGGFSLPSLRVSKIRDSSARASGLGTCNSCHARARIIYNDSNQVISLVDNCRICASLWYRMPLAEGMV